MQYITGFDLFGFKSLGPKNPGPFKDELISGGYLERFSFFSFFSFMHMSENYKNKKFSNIAFIFIIAFHSVAMLLSGNRMPLLLYFIGYFIIFFLVKKIRLVMTIAFIIFAASFYGIIQKDPIIKNYTYASFINNVNIFNFNKTIDVKKGEIKNEEKLKNEINEKRLIFLRTTGHQAIYQTAYLIWQEQPFFGFGLKSFRIKCFDILIMAGHQHWAGVEHRKNLKIRENWKNKRLTCATHPHNYYLELLTESGIIGTVLMLLLFIILIKKSLLFLKKGIGSKSLSENLIIPIIVIFFLEIWPIKSTGSFFTTWNATFFWIIVGLLFSTKFSSTKKII